ncbi:MAG: secretion protein HlyD [Proteobacteria bacterium]|nr:MAG: secretion protein HlyD [Pseudomonadota bacterium]
MIRKYAIPALAVLGLLLGLRTVLAGTKKPPVAQPVVAPSRSPYKVFVAGTGILEASSENLAIAAPVGRIVKEVPVEIGARVSADDVLFVLDDRDVRADLAVKEAAVLVAKSELDDAKVQLQMRESLSDRRALSAEELTRSRLAVQAAEARLKLAEGQLEAVRTELERLHVRAPISGQVLQRNVRPGEFAPAQVLNPPLILLGSTNTLHVRVDIDENDAWRVDSGAKAHGYMRGNPEIGSELEFVRFEPYVIPKRSLTGESTERVDTRVLQIIYRLKDRNIAVFAGQLMDIFIQDRRSESFEK